MFLSHHRTQNDSLNLQGAVRISNNPFFVFRNAIGNVVLKSGIEENAQKCAVEHMVELNPKVKQLLGRFKLRLEINTKTLKELANGHMNDTCNVAIGIYSELSDDIKQGISEEKIKGAAMLHDLGKVLIPPKILNKPSRLNKKERKIMNIHSILGYELLKTQDIDEEILDLVKYHHQNLSKTGYPLISEKHIPSNIGVQIISTADKYSALREARVYRRRLTRIESLLILYKEVLEGKIHKDIYNALLRYVSKYD